MTHLSEAGAPLAIRVYEWGEIPVYGADQGETWLAIRVYEWVEIFNEYIHQLIEEDLQSVYMSGLKYRV